jgi:hypothetical protein
MEGTGDRTDYSLIKMAIMPALTSTIGVDD